MAYRALTTNRRCSKAFKLCRSGFVYTYWKSTTGLWDLSLLGDGRINAARPIKHPASISPRQIRTNEIIYVVWQRTCVVAKYEIPERSNFSFCWVLNSQSLDYSWSQFAYFTIFPHFTALKFWITITYLL